MKGQVKPDWRLLHLTLLKSFGEIKEFIAEIEYAYESSQIKTFLVFIFQLQVNACTSPGFPSEMLNFSSGESRAIHQLHTLKTQLPKPQTAKNCKSLIHVNTFCLQGRHYTCKCLVNLWVQLAENKLKHYRRKSLAFVYPVQHCDSYQVFHTSTIWTVAQLSH